MSEPQLGDRRAGTNHIEVYILVDGTPTWRAATWEWRNQEPFLRWVPIPILGENEVLMETVEGPVEILTKPFSRLT